VPVLGPIFSRELMTVPRSPGHYVTRAAYLGSLWVIAVTAWLAILGYTGQATLGETARFGPVLFQVLTYVQLALVLFFAALSCASAIAKEKDRRTFVLLLMTPMRDDEIVLGKVLGSLLPILVLQLAAVPLLVLLILLGGIALDQVVQVVLIQLATSLAAGALGGVVALWRDKTFQALALTALFLVLYLAAVRGVGALLGALAVADETTTSIQGALEPFVALAHAHQPTLPGEAGLAPAYTFSLVMLGLAGGTVLFGMWKLRAWNPSGEPIMQRETPEEAVDREKELMSVEARGPTRAPAGIRKEPGGVEVVPEVIAVGRIKQEGRVSAHAAPGEVREVTGNPILWREMNTLAYGRRPLMVKAAYLVALLFIVYFTFIGPVVMRGEGSPFTAALGLLSVGVLSLLLVTAQATTAITSERDTGALDLLLVTDLSPREFIFGKLLGVLYNTKEYLLPPLLLAVGYAAYSCLAVPPRGYEATRERMNAVALLAVIAATCVLLAFAAVFGVHVALRNQNSQLAIIHSLSTIFFLTVGTLVCIALILINGRFEYQWGSFIFFLIAGVGGLWYVLSGDRPSGALTWAAWFCPLAVLYSVMTVLVGRPGSQETADPLIPTLVMGFAFGFAITAMLVPLLSEFDVAMGRTSGGAD
jgi:ABC-type transport system involved in multi-copper enzyme maturation permease subunit